MAEAAAAAEVKPAEVEKPVKATKAAAEKPAKAPKAPAKKKEKEPKPAKAPKASAGAVVPKKPRKMTHPPYLVMVKEALLDLKERNGSSVVAIQKYLEDKHKDLPPNWRKTLTIQLRNLTKAGKLLKVKASYKLSDELKPAKPRSKKSSMGAADKATTGEAKAKSSSPAKAKPAKPAKKTAGTKGAPKVKTVAKKPAAGKKASAMPKKTTSKKATASKPPTKKAKAAAAAAN